MNIDNQKNGNNQLNSIRNEFNYRTKKKFFQVIQLGFIGLIIEGLEQYKLRQLVAFIVNF